MPTHGAHDSIFAGRTRLLAVTTEPPPNAAREPLVVAIDVAPLLSPLTGVGAAVEQIISAMAGEPDISLKPYACSFRGTLQPGTTRLPLPAAVSQRLWAHFRGPKVDRWLRPAQVIHGTNYTVAPSRLPRIVTVYDCWFLRNPSQAPAAVVRAGQVLRRAVDSGAVVHACSHATADSVRELLHASRVEVISFAALPITGAAVAAEQMPPVAELVGVPYILALGTLERRKNLPRLVAAFGQIAHANPEVRLALVGADGDDRQAINAAIDGLFADTRERVMCTGRIDESAKRWFLQHAQVLAYPSLDEGFGFPLLEAMGYDLPVVASTAGSIPEVAGDAAILVGPHDVTALAEALQRALTDSSVREGLVEAGRRRINHYSWPETASGLAGLYHQLAQEGIR
jgi:glycosyltransferase involved in cell wall biosynthesis